MKPMLGKLYSLKYVSDFHPLDLLLYILLYILYVEQFNTWSHVFERNRLHIHHCEGAEALSCPTQGDFRYLYKKLNGKKRDLGWTSHEDIASLGIIWPITK